MRMRLSIDVMQPRLLVVLVSSRRVTLLLFPIDSMAEEYAMNWEVVASRRN
jgi:hypothetical protein